MSFTDDIVRIAWGRAGAACECTRSACATHWRRHMKKLAWDLRGRDLDLGWEARPRTAFAAGGGNIPSNCEIVCFECLKKNLCRLG